MAETKKTAKSKTKKESAQKKTAAAPAITIDTSMAAAAAARMVAHGVPAEPAADAHQSAAFKKLKESLNKPSAQGIAGFIQSTAPIKKAGTPFTGRNEPRRGQTFGADVNRTGVPRRTGG